MIKTKERNAIINALRSGVVPKIGLQHIQVGRNNELHSCIENIETIADGGTSFRFVIGEYGSGKTFFLSLVRSIALEKGLVTMNADLSPEKKLHGTNGQTRMLLSELVANLSTRTKQDGQALPNIIERFISIAKEQADADGKTVPATIHEKLKELNELPGGYSFASVIAKYWEGYESGNDDLKNCALRWLRAEYTTKTESNRDLGVREYIDDKAFLNVLKLYSVLAVQAGYKGLLVNIDEMVNLYKITHSDTRKKNYEEILYILNSTLQGTMSNIGFIMGGTPEFLTDTARGVYSYDALRTRLSENTFARQHGLADYKSTVLRLANLTPEELYVLMANLRNVFASGDASKYLVPDEALTAFLKHCSDKIGDSYFRTPRSSIKSFLDFLSVLEQNPDVKWTDLVQTVAVEKDFEETETARLAGDNSGKDDEFSNFSL